MLKKCRKCLDEKEITNFNPDRLGKYGVWSTCKQCIKEKQLNTPPPVIKQTEIRKIWKKTINRIKEKGSETKLFIEIWQNRPHICQNCKKEIQFFDLSSFAHILRKGTNDKWRYDVNNIALVHSIRTIKDWDTGETYNCHWEIDAKMTWRKLEFEELLIEWDDEKIKDFINNLI